MSNKYQGKNRRGKRIKVEKIQKGVGARTLSASDLKRVRGGIFQIAQDITEHLQKGKMEAAKKMDAALRS